MKVTSTFLEIMKMSGMLTVEVITKHDSPYLPYLGVIRMLQSVYRCDDKNKVNHRQKQLPKCREQINVSRIAIRDLFLKLRGAKCLYFLKIRDTKNN